MDIEAEEHTSHVVLGGGEGIPTNDYGTPAVEVLDEPLAPTMDENELERLRVLAGTPRWGREIDDRVLPAEAGLDERAISFTKGCYPGQEPVARLHYRGRANRGLRVLEIESDELPAYDAELSYEGKVVDASRARSAKTAALRLSPSFDARFPRRPSSSCEVRPARFERATSASAGQRSIP